MASKEEQATCQIRMATGNRMPSKIRTKMVFRMVKKVSMTPGSKAKVLKASSRVPRANKDRNLNNKVAPNQNRSNKAILSHNHNKVVAVANPVKAEEALEPGHPLKVSRKNSKTNSHPRTLLIFSKRSLVSNQILKIRNTKGATNCGSFFCKSFS